MQLDTDLKLIAGWNPNNPQLSFHHGYNEAFSQTFSSDGTCIEVVKVNKNPRYIAHGALMWVAWALIGLL